MHCHDPEDGWVDPAAIKVRAVQEKRVESSEHQREKNGARPAIEESVNLHVFPRANEMRKQKKNGWPRHPRTSSGMGRTLRPDKRGWRNLRMILARASWAETAWRCASRMGHRILLRSK